MKLLALEISTSSHKAQYYDTLTGYSRVLSARNIVTASIDELCNQVILLGRNVAEGNTVDRITTAGTWHSLVVCNARHTPVMPLSDWMDIPSRSLCDTLRKDDSFVDSYYHQSGAMVNAIYPFFTLLKLQKEGALSTQHRVSSLASYLHYRLTGAWKETASMLSGMGLLSTQDTSIHQMAKDLNCTIAPLAAWDCVSPLSEEAGRILGQKAGIAVLPPFPDGSLNQVGSEAEDEQIMTLSMGTSAALRLSVSSPWFSPTRSTWLYRSPTSYLLGAATSGCANCVDWYKTLAFASDISYAMIEQPLKHETEIPIFLPFIAGERCPGWIDTRQSSFHDLVASTSASVMYQAVLAGVVANIYQCYEQILKSSQEIKTIRLSGGVLQSSFWKHMCCNYFGLPMEEDTQAQASLFGALVLASRSVGEDLFKTLAVKRNRLEPDARLHALYQEHYKRYLHWYTKTK
nr:FGGY-family carbohydrate kinase [uncultured Sphaerochaeta sp.]